ncbi:acyl carrier protein [Micromonospora sp. NPDC050686]|uniref:acyl carrier protein n=1 Tax=Micromonospora sp. NPDC050686 TaxID=3154631 RepID=UPI0033D89214
MVDSIATAQIRADQVPALIHQVVRRISPLDPRAVGDTLRLSEDLGYDSLALAELSFTLEDLFGLSTLTPDRVLTIDEVRDVVSLIEQALADDRAHLPARSDVEKLFKRNRAVSLPPG